MTEIPPNVLQVRNLEISTNRMETIYNDEATRVTTPNQKSLLKKRVSRLLKLPENKFCLDCSSTSPKWITILSVPSPCTIPNNQNLNSFQIGGLCCLECSGAHRRLGTHISFVRSIELDTLKESDVEALERGGGNESVNRIFEGNLFDKSMGERCVNIVSAFSTMSSLKPDPDANQKSRELYIRNKYEKKLYIDLKELCLFRQSMIKNVSLGDSISPCNKYLTSPISSSSTADSISTPPLKLQVFTSSPRTLAMIEKYMNPPKSKRKNIGVIIRNSLRRYGPRSARKKYFKKSLRGLHGVVSINPDVNIVETRSEELNDSDSECDYDKYSEEGTSVTSTRSSASVFLRRSSVSAQNRLRSYQHVSKTTHRTQTPTKAEKRRNIFKNKQKKSKEKRNCIDNEDEMQAFQINDENLNYDHTPSTPKACKSPRFRLTPYLRTPKRKNLCLETTREVEIVRSPAHAHDGAEDYFSSLESVTEGHSQRSLPHKSDSRNHDYIKAMKDWSNDIGNVMGRMSKWRGSTKTKSKQGNKDEDNDQERGQEILLTYNDNNYLGASTM